MFLAGLRFGEVSALSWRHFEPAKKPLGRLVVAAAYNTRRRTIGLTKTQTTRAHPIHPALAAFLETWRGKGWPFFFGRAPNSDDLIVPSRTGRPRSNNHMKNKFDEDLAKLGLRKRRQHDARKTWLTQLVADGARREILERITHARKTDVMSGYIEFEWPTLCAEVAKWTLTLGPPPAPAEPSFPNGDRPSVNNCVDDTDTGTLSWTSIPDANWHFTDTQKNTPVLPGVSWRSGRDSNPRPPA